MDYRKVKQDIIDAGYKAIEQLIDVAKEEILRKDADPTEDLENVDDAPVALAADRLKNAAAAKKLAIFDAFDILDRIESEKQTLDENAQAQEHKAVNGGFAERRAKSK